MIPSLFAFELKQLLRRLAGLFILAFLPGLGAVWLYAPPLQENLRRFSEEMPFAARLLGYAGSANLPVHLAGVLGGLFLPLLFVIAGLSLAQRLIARPISDGRMAQRLAAPHRRGALILTFFWLMAFEVLVISLAALMGEAAGVFIFLGGQADFAALTRLALACGLSALPVTGLMALLAALAASPRGARRLGLFLGLVFLGLMMASRLPGWARYLACGTPFGLMAGQALLGGASALLRPALGLPIALLLALLGAWGFSNRDL